jgi:hypothetical protein
MPGRRKTRLVAMGAAVVVVVVVALAFALGGQHASTDSESAGPASPHISHGAPGLAPAATSTGSSGASFGATRGAAAAPKAAPLAPVPAAAANGVIAPQGQVESVADAVTATRVVKTGSMELRVTRNHVQSTVSRLVAITTQLGGYVSQSRTDNMLGSPDGEVTLRIPAGQFDSAVTAVERLGHVTSLTTNADDVTGRFVDLSARLSALQRTRATYLTILGRATTIGATLEVQQRVDDVQQQIEELQGQLKVLRNQSADGTLTVDVSQVGSASRVHHTPKQHGIGKAWHTSISRFDRGFDAIVGALGPLLLAIMILAVLLGVGRLGYRGVRRATS